MITLKKALYYASMLFVFAIGTAYADEIIKVTVNLGQPIPVTLESPTPETHMWNLQKTVDNKYLIIDRNKDVTRDGDKETWIFRNHKRGTTFIYMQYEAKKDPLKSNAIKYTIEVTIK